jgi:hypothetical protein
MGKSRSLISVKGGGLLKVRELSPTPTNTFTDLGYLGESSLDDAYNIVESKDDAGHFIDAKEAGQVVKFVSSLLQTSKTEIDFMKNAAAKYFEAYYQVKLNNGSYQEYLFPVCRITPGQVLDFKAAERRIKITINALWLPSALTRTPTDYNTAADAVYVMIENSSAVGAPTDAATVPAAAI